MDSEASDEEVEEQFTMQLEQLIKQCEDELGLIPKMAEWKPWDVPAGHKVLLQACCSAALCLAQRPQQQLRPQQSSSLEVLSRT